MIGGFIITGTEPKKVIMRAIGPSLTGLGVQNALADPTLELRKGAALVAANDNWKEGQRSQIEASGIAPTDDLESAIVATLPPGEYTGIVRGVDDTTGIAVVEVYDLDPLSASELANISTRGLVQSGEGVLIGGFIIAGDSTNHTNVIVRAIGPSLGAAGVPNPVLDPTLDVRDADGARVAFNDDWASDPVQAEAILGRNLVPTSAAESAVALNLPGGHYTAIVASKTGDPGVALIEVYNVH